MDSPNQKLTDGTMPISELIRILQKIKKIDPDAKGRINRGMLYFRTELPALRGLGGIYLEAGGYEDLQKKIDTN